MIDFALVRALHVLAIVLWIGGVGMVTTVLLPAVRPEAAYRALVWLHRALLTRSLLTVAGAVSGSQGVNLLTW